MRFEGASAKVIRVLHGQLRIVRLVGAAPFGAGDRAQGIFLQLRDRRRAVVLPFELE